MDGVDIGDLQADAAPAERLDGMPEEAQSAG